MRKITWHECENCGTPYIIEDGRQCNCTDEQIKKGMKRQRLEGHISDAIFLLERNGYKVTKLNKTKQHKWLNSKRPKF